MSARKEFASKKRFLVKAGTGVLTDAQGRVSLGTFSAKCNRFFFSPLQTHVGPLGRIGHLVEQVSELKKQGKEVIIVSSGAIAVGKQLLLALHQDPRQDHNQGFVKPITSSFIFYLSSMMCLLFGFHLNK